VSTPCRAQCHKIILALLVQSNTDNYENWKSLHFKIRKIDFNSGFSNLLLQKLNSTYVLICSNGAPNLRNPLKHTEVIVISKVLQKEERQDKLWRHMAQEQLGNFSSNSELEVHHPKGILQKNLVHFSGSVELQLSDNGNFFTPVKYTLVCHALGFLGLHDTLLITLFHWIKQLPAPRHNSYHLSTPTL